MEGFLGILPEYCCWLVLLLTDPKKIHLYNIWEYENIFLVNMIKMDWCSEKDLIRPVFKCRPTFPKCRPTFRFQPLTATTSPLSFDMAFWKLSADISGKIRHVADISRKCQPTFREKPNMLVGLESWSNREISIMS